MDTYLENIVKKYDKLVGYHVIEPDYKLVEEKIKNGYNFIAFSLDTYFLGSIIRDQLEKIREIWI